LKICIHRGAHQIGGSCVELEAQGKRLVIDLGLPLDAEANSPDLLPKVMGLQEPAGDLLGVLISHSHMDHYLLLAHARPDLPVAMGAGARRILEAASPWMRDAAVPAAGPVLEDQKRFAWGPFTITPYLVDHSAFDAFALLVEADGKRVFYSGDFRAHGRTAWRFERLMKDPPAALDVLLMEGSSLGRLDLDARFQTESELEDGMVAAFKGTEGMALVCASAQNIDRIVTLFRAAKRSGRRLLIDLYTAAILEATGHSSIPQSHWDGVALYVPEYQERQIARNHRLDLLDRHSRNRVMPDTLATQAPRSALLFRKLHQRDLVTHNALAGARIFYSLWEGYLKQTSGLELQAWADAHGVPLQPLHTSGHASPADLKRFAAGLNPKVVVPIHTFMPEAYGELFTRVEKHEDGEWWGMGQ
jgi:ribonuclease J